MDSAITDSTMPTAPALTAGEIQAAAPEMSRTLDAASIRGADDRKRVRVECPEWGGATYVRTMSGAERDLFEDIWRSARESGNTVAGIMAKVVVLVLCDEEGNRLFSDDDWEWLNEKSCSAICRCYGEAMKLNRLSHEEFETLLGN